MVHSLLWVMQDLYHQPYKALMQRRKPRWGRIERGFKMERPRGHFALILKETTGGECKVYRASIRLL